MPDVNTWLASFDQLAANPGDIQTLALSQVEESYAGIADLGNPTSPFISLMQASSVNTAGAMRSYDAYNRRLYGAMSQTPQDLYVHMSDVDYLDRFAIPSSATFSLFYEKDELLASMVDTGSNGIKQLIIPRYTSITVNEVTFTMQYPILIRQMARGGLQIVYDNSIASPLYPLATNQVTWESVVVSSDSGPINFIRLDIPMQQMAVTSKIGKFNSAQPLIQNYVYSDQFYYCRAYSLAANGTVTEILTTHTSQVFDPTKPTLLLRDLGGTLQVELPYIYITNGLVDGEIQVDIYTTKGDLSMALTQYGPNAYVITYAGASTAESPYVAPLTTFKTYMFFSESTTAGGSNGVSFTQLRDQVLTNNFGPVVLPITTTQLSNRISKLGFSSVINVDDVTDRVVLATRAMDPPSSGLTYSGASMSIETLTASFDSLSTFSSFVSNGSRGTILPSMLYKLVNGVVTPVTDTEIAATNALEPENRIQVINSTDYLYSPFHYVMDATGNTFEIRPYYLDQPYLDVLQFIQQNETVGIVVSTGDKELVRTATGYRLRLTASSSNEWKQLADADVFCQLAFIPEGETDYAYLNGTLIGLSSNNERIYEFALTTNYDIDAANNISLTTFSMFMDGPRPHAIPLNADLDIFWIANGVQDSQTSTTQIDVNMGTQLVPAGSLGIQRERLSVVLGQALGNVWHESRAVAGSGTYQVYSTDVHQTYDANVYDTDPATGLKKITTNGSTISFTLLHKAGDQVLDANGNPIIAHHAGDRVLDSAGNPILVSPGTLQYQMDLLMVEGVYYFASSADAASYAATIPSTIVSWVNDDLSTVTPFLLEKTRLYFYPQASLGDVNVLIQNGRTKTIEAPQTFTVTFYMDNAGYNDTTLQAPIQKTTVQVLSQALSKQSVSLSSINTTLEAAISANVVGFDVVGLGGADALTTLTVLNDAQRLSIRKLAVVEADGTIGVEDGVTTAFKLHDPSVESLNS